MSLRGQSANMDTQMQKLMQMRHNVKCRTTPNKSRNESRSRLNDEQVKRSNATLVEMKHGLEKVNNQITAVQEQMITENDGIKETHQSLARARLKKGGGRCNNLIKKTRVHLARMVAPCEGSCPGYRRRGCLVFRCWIIS